MAISPEKKQLIHDIAAGTWVDRLPPSDEQAEGEFERKQAEVAEQLKKFLHYCSSAEELHEFVVSYNWDDGEATLIKIIENPNCDRNTALLVFWLGSPDFYQEYASVEELPSTSEPEALELLNRIQSNLLAGKYSKQNMPDEFKHEIVKPSGKAKWEINKAMYGGHPIPTPSSRLR